MHQFSSSATLAGELTARADELATLVRRVEAGRATRPRIDTHGWSGPASLACDLSLAVLAQQLDECVDLLRRARDLTEAAAWEARTGA